MILSCTDKKVSKEALALILRFYFTNFNQRSAKRRTSWCRFNKRIFGLAKQGIVEVKRTTAIASECELERKENSRQ